MNTNTLKNSFMTKFLVLLLLAGVATLAAPMAVQAVAPTVTTVEIIPEGTQSGKSLYAYARQNLLGDWDESATRADLVGGQTGTLLVRPGYSLKDSLGEGQAVKFFKVGDEIKVKVTFDMAVTVVGNPALRLNFDGELSDGMLKPHAVYDKPATDAESNNAIVYFKYTVQAGDDCFGDGIGFANGSAADTKAYVADADTNYIHGAGTPADKFAPGQGDFHAKINQFYWNMRDSNPDPPWPRPRGTAYIHDGLKYLIDTIKASVRITGLIKPDTHSTNDLRTAPMDFTTGDFAKTDANVDVTETEDVTGPFDVEFLFFNYGIGTKADGVLADTTQGFEAADIKITGPGVAANQAGWTVEGPTLIGLDHRDAEFPGKSNADIGLVKHSSGFKVYKATITPPVDYDGDVMITVPAGATMDIAGNPNLLSNTLNVSIISLAATLGVPTKGTRALPAVPVDAKGFVVLAHEGASISNTGLAKGFHPTAHLPNLENLLGPDTNGGTIELVDTRTPATKGPIITEIMWGSDLSQADPKFSQWIEIYNAGDAIELSNYQLKITPALSGTFSADDNAVDTVGNLGNGKWAVPGQGGRTVAVAATEETAGADVVPLISMRRKINIDNAKVEGGALKGVNNGTLSGSWEASTTPTLNIASNRIATPGAKPATQITAAQRTNITYGPVIINEIGYNTETPDNFWIELRAKSAANLKNWRLNVITAKGTEEPLVRFGNFDINLGAGKILLVVKKDPLTTPLARGKKFADSGGITAAADQEKHGLQTDAMFYEAGSEMIVENLPDSGDKLLLVLRSGNDKDRTPDKIADISGNLFEPDPALSTNIWPLKATPAGNGNAIAGNAAGFEKNKVYRRNKADKGFDTDNVWVVAGYTGLGYDRSAGNTAANGGTPGFPNDALKEKPGDLAGGAVTISEIMVVSDGGRYPQWIELRNSSATQGINLNDWHLRIENVGTDVDSRQNVTINLPNGYIIGPNQTLLIATRRGSAPQPLNSQRVMLLWTDSGGARQALEVDNSRFSMLSMKGFTLELFGKDVALTGTPTDTVTIGAELLTADKIGNPEQRISLIRYYDSRVATDNWVSAKGSEQLIQIPSDTYYGIADDIGTPGYYPGTALPVSLSSFLPKRTDAGVVIKWTTQSELNNAGFNILRSATKTGAFVVINPTMIRGAGTTGEKTTYSYTDKTAKPNIVYYYQLEDVSFDGHRQRLTGATRLRGHIGAANKLTTTWGNLKAQD